MGNINSSGNASGISVIIFRYNSAARLSQTLEQLAKTKIFKIVNEPKPGQMYSEKRGVVENWQPDRFKE